MKGGKRSNTRRKPIEETRVTLSVRVKRETKAELHVHDTAKLGNTSIGRVIDKLVNDEKIIISFLLNKSSIYRK